VFIGLGVFSDTCMGFGYLGERMLYRLFWHARGSERFHCFED
jgi:hypothetical protein